MKRRRIGKSDLYVSEVSFGCMSLRHDESDMDVLLSAVDAGINYFDTADLYEEGMNEELVGRALAGRRKDVLLATKTGNVWKQDGSGWEWKPSKSHILVSVEESLRRLRTDYIDLYQLHGGTLEDPIDEIIEAFEILKSQGKIRHYGISSIRPNVIREYVQRSSIVSVMSQYSLLDRRIEETVIPLLSENHISILARGSIAQGLLIDKAPTEYLDHTADVVKHAATLVQENSGETGSAVAAAMRFVLHQPAVASVVAGIRTSRQLQDAAEAGKSMPLTEAQYARLAGGISPNTFQQHR